MDDTLFDKAASASNNFVTMTQNFVDSTCVKMTPAKYDLPQLSTSKPLDFDWKKGPIVYLSRTELHPSNPTGLWIRPSRPNLEMDVTENAIMHYGSVMAQTNPSFFTIENSKTTWNLPGCADEISFQTKPRDMITAVTYIAADSAVITE